MSSFDVWCRSCGCKMVLRRGKFGEFYGCTGYPQCKNTLNRRDAALNYILEDEEDVPLDMVNEVGHASYRWDRKD